MSARFLSLDRVERYVPLASALGVSKVARSRAGFLAAYRRAKGKPALLPEKWQRKREGFIKRHLAQIRMRTEPLFVEGEPTRRHLALIMWAYSPVSSRI